MGKGGKEGGREVEKGDEREQEVKERRGESKRCKSNDEKKKGDN